MRTIRPGPPSLIALLLGVVLLLAVPCAAAADVKPALVVVIVVDGLPQEQVVKYRDLYGPGGLRRLLEEGAWFGDAHHGHAVTTTGPGHATVLTGTYPYRHGIIANEWHDRRTLAEVYCTGDSSHTYIGEETGKLSGTSPANLRVTTLGDELRYSNNDQFKVVAISGKDRGAILLAGKRGTAYIYMNKSGRFASSTYYMKEHPAWHARYYSGKPQDRWAGQTWRLLLPERAYARSVPETMPWMSGLWGVGARFPFVLPGLEKAGAYYATLMLTPFGDEATLDFARAAVEGENLGRNRAGVSDILALSLSTHDIINHAFGPESRPSQDHLLHLDRALAGFFAWLDRRIGLDKVVIALTSDHGFMNSPEYSAARGLAAGRFDRSKFMAALNEHLAARFSAKNLAARYSTPTIMLDLSLMAKALLDPAEVEAAAARFTRDYPGVAAVYTRTQLESGALPDLPLSLQVQRAWNRELSGDLYVVLNPHIIASSSVTTHGSPWRYDTNIPLMIYGKRWIRPGEYPRAAAVADLAPTLAYLLDVRPPAASEGRVLKEILR